MHILREMEKQMGDAVADIIDQDPGRTDSPTPTAASPLSGIEDIGGTMAPVEETRLCKTQSRRKNKSPAELEKPVLTPLQLRLIDNLNRLPGLKKERVWINPVRNSHAIIVCRDVKRFEGHRMGEGVLRHWADHFAL
jgi:hypothetical protein